MEKCPQCGMQISKSELDDGLCNPCHYCDGTGILPARQCDMCEGSGRLHPVKLETVQKALDRLPKPIPWRCDICGETDLLDHTDGEEGTETCRDSLSRQLAAEKAKVKELEAVVSDTWSWYSIDWRYPKCSLELGMRWQAAAQAGKKGGTQ